ncbi:MAG: TIGR04282 family arsenosugar biosynthesis glycosyltransferase [Bacillota bacterium]|nr:TIGR04282 family arsenosugar biosynthesis glycosyltransferase [Bacillota bacterium]
MDKLRLIIFTRYPEAGQVKTRLIPTLGIAGAAALHRKMTEQTITKTSLFKGEIEVRFTGGNLNLMKKWLGNNLLYREQIGSNLGISMNNAMADAFFEKKNKAVIIGTDCPGLRLDHINSAFDELDRSDLVLGPAHDGGYYLIGLRKIQKELFKGITWGSDKVYQQTLDAAARLNLRITELKCLADVDKPEDLALWITSENLTGVL